jgi:hypothetical protein
MTPSLTPELLLLLAKLVSSISPEQKQILTEISRSGVSQLSADLIETSTHQRLLLKVDEVPMLSMWNRLTTDPPEVE